MVRAKGRKSAISLTLDDDVLNFFKGKNRSQTINRILKGFIRFRLGDTDSNQFTFETKPRSLLMKAMRQCGLDEKGKLMWSMLNTIRESIPMDGDEE